jgi:hypothetical protein
MGKKKKKAVVAGALRTAARAKDHPARQVFDHTAEERRAATQERRARKLEYRKKDKKLITADMWALPAPADLMAKGRLERPKVKSKYYSYFEFAENTEKKDKKLEFQVRDRASYVSFY